MINRGALLAVALPFVADPVACSPTENAGRRDDLTGVTRGAIIEGKPSGASQDATVLLLRSADSSSSGVANWCTGTLLSARLVLTARHCVVEQMPGARFCTAEGGRPIRRNYEADSIYVFTGPKPPWGAQPRASAAGRGMTIIDDGSEDLCNQDVALLLLKDPIEGASIAPIRLDIDVAVGDTTTVVGWGLTENGVVPRQRLQRSNVRVVKVGVKEVDSETGLSSNEFMSGEAICSGDSGGPAYSPETNAVIGVSSSVIYSHESSDNVAAKCVGARSVFTKTSPFKDLILGAFDLAVAEPWLEGEPDPRKLKPKAVCGSDDECRSGLCLPDPDAANETTCAEDCSATERCSAPGDVCTPEGEWRVCRAPSLPIPPPGGGACATSPDPPSGARRLGVVTLTLGLLALTRRRRSTP